jgi:hypothetical protein
LIDFRYHLVSIVSIFLALAVGIVLGAGPLKGELGNTLNKEVAGLRQDKAELNGQLDEARAGADAQDSYIGETNPSVLSGVLADRRVALVVLPGADAAVAEASAATVRSSGGSVVSTTSVTDDWVSIDDATAAARDEAVTKAAAEAGIDVRDSGSVSPRDILLAALLTTPASGTARPLAAATAVKGLDVLAADDLLEIDTKGFQSADLVLVISGVATKGDLAARNAAAKRWVDLVVALDGRSSGTLVAGEATTASDGVVVIDSIRNDATATKGVSTVDNAGGSLGQASVSHGLAQQYAGGSGQYGLGPGVDAPYAPFPAT